MHPRLSPQAAASAAHLMCPAADDPALIWAETGAALRLPGDPWTFFQRIKTCWSLKVDFSRACADLPTASLMFAEAWAALVC